MLRTARGTVAVAVAVASASTARGTGAGAIATAAAASISLKPANSCCGRRRLVLLQLFGHDRHRHHNQKDSKEQRGWWSSTRCPCTGNHNLHHNHITSQWQQHRSFHSSAIFLCSASRNGKFYAVAYGTETGIFQTWAECQTQVRGVRGAIFKSFTNIDEAQEFLDKHRATAASVLAPTTTSDDSSIVSCDQDRAGFYAVARGIETGIFLTWAECEKQVRGVRGAKFKFFSNREEAQGFLGNYATAAAAATVGKTTNTNDSVEISNRNQDWTVFRSQIHRGRTVQPLHDIIVHDSDPEVELIEVTTATRIPFPRTYIRLWVQFDSASGGNDFEYSGAGAWIHCQQTPVLQNKDEETRTLNNQQNDKKGLQRNVFIRHYLGNHNSNHAGYQALCSGLERAVTEARERVESLSPISNIILQCLVEGDSKSVICEMTGRYKRPDHSFIAQAEEHKATLQSLEAEGKVKVEIKFAHVSHDENKIADALAKEAIDKKESWLTVTDE